MTLNELLNKVTERSGRIRKNLASDPDYYLSLDQASQLFRTIIIFESYILLFYNILQTGSNHDDKTIANIKKIIDTALAKLYIERSKVHQKYYMQPTENDKAVYSTASPPERLKYLQRNLVENIQYNKNRYAPRLSEHDELNEVYSELLSSGALTNQLNCKPTVVEVKSDAPPITHTISQAGTELANRFLPRMGMIRKFLNPSNEEKDFQQNIEGAYIHLFALQYYMWRIAQLSDPNLIKKHGPEIDELLGWLYKKISVDKDSLMPDYPKDYFLMPGEAGLTSFLPANLSRQSSRMLVMTAKQGDQAAFEIAASLAPTNGFDIKTLKEAAVGCSNEVIGTRLNELIRNHIPSAEEKVDADIAALKIKLNEQIKNFEVRAKLFYSSGNAIKAKKIREALARADKYGHSSIEKFLDCKELESVESIREALSYHRHDWRRAYYSLFSCFVSPKKTTSQKQIDELINNFSSQKNAHR